MLKKSVLSLALLGSIGVANADVLTTIKPLGFIANAITDGVTETKVLLPTTASPHDYSLKPSDIEQLQAAQLVVWIGDEMERFLVKSLTKLPQERVITLEKIESIQAIVKQSKKAEVHHSHSHQHEKAHHHAHDHHHDEDWHIWLSPLASEQIAEKIAQKLSEQMPDKRGKIAENLVNFKTGLQHKNAEIKSQLENVKGKGYYTFHDAYGYFEDHYGLNSLGSFTINPAVSPGAKTLNTIKKNIAEHQAHCLFAEPQFTPKVIESLSKGTTAKVGQLDPLGVNISFSATAYPEFLQSLADQFSVCLSSSK